MCIAPSDARLCRGHATPTGEALLALPPFTGKPVMVLSAAAPIGDDSELARDALAKRKDIARLNPGSRQIWVDSGHAIPLEKPEAVIAAIRELLQLARPIARR
jgi:pimeloyl-ACP methyl ester carboxylesterase